MLDVRLSLVIPAFNEEAGIRQAILEADQALSGLCADYEILIVDDGSRDATSAVVTDEAASRPHVRLLRHETNRGYGAALRTGFTAAAFDLVAFTDADCQFHLEDLASLLPLTEQAPVAVGYRMDRKDPWRRRFLSGGYNLLARTLLGTTVRDIDCALKVFRRDALRTILPDSTGFFVNTEMLTCARQQGLDVAEVGVRHRPRVRGQSTVSLREVPKTLKRMLPFWWSEVMFAGDAPSDRGERRCVSPPCLGERRGVSPPCSHTRRAYALPLASDAAGLRTAARLLPIVLLLVLACLLFFVRLRAPLLEPQEARYAEIPRLMLAEDRLLIPTLHEQDYLDKPPLLYWSVMASYRLFGMRDVSARIVPGLACVLTVLLTYFWGRRTLGARAGFCAAVILCLMPEFIYRGRMLTFDSLLMLWVTASLAAGHLAMQTTHLRWGWWLISAFACGLGLLTKGPVALVLIVPPLALVSLLDPRLARPGWRSWAAFLGIALMTAAPWYAAVIVARPDFAPYFFWKHNVVRFVAPFDHARPIWFYVANLAVGLMPWVLLVPILVRMLFARSGRMARRRPGALGLALASFLWMFVFFSLAGCKRATYLLPALPPLALALGWVVATRAPAWRLLLVRRARLAAATAGVALASAAIVALTAALVQMIRPQSGFVAAGVALVLMTLVLAFRRVPWAVSALLVFGVLFAGVRELLPAYNDQFSVRGQLRRQVGPDELQRPVVCYPMRYDSVRFYLPQSSVRVFGYGEKAELLAHLEANPNTLVVIKSGSVYRDLVRDLPAGTLIRTRGQRGAVTVGRVVRVAEPGEAVALGDKSIP